MHSFDAILAAIPAQTVLCVGDLMRDEFVYGEVTRISPEAATPVLAVRRQEAQIGGAGNAARNVASLGAICLFVGVVGDDLEGRALRAELLAMPRVEADLLHDAERATTRKVRFVSEHHSTHLLRADWETTSPLAAAIEDRVIARVRAALPRAGAVLLSDYGKGVLTPRVVGAVIAEARRAGKPIIVDPKGPDYTLYTGATLITPNLNELAEAVRLPVGSTAEIETAAAALANLVQADAVVVTRSEDGISLVRPGGSTVHVPAHAVRVRDVSGAGDTVAAALAICLAMGADLDATVHIANAAGSVAVSKRGTATVTLSELRARLVPRAADAKIVDARLSLSEMVADWRRDGLRVGFTNGCFDLLHPGHIAVLTAARAACDRLIVGLNSDASTRRLKGPQRPIQGEHERAAMLAALKAVDAVVIFDQATPLALIEQVLPDVLVKGADYRREDVVGRELVEAAGGEVLLVDLLPGHSTTGLVKALGQTS